MNIDDLQIIKPLGHGMIGTVYLVKHKLTNKQYALKIERILNDEKSYTQSIWREIDFSQQCGNKYVNNFTKLYTYDIIDNCKHKQEYNGDLKLCDKEVQQHLFALSKSNYCCRRVYSLIDTTLDKIWDNLNLNQIYSVIIQLCYSILLMIKHGYSHNDLHKGNIGVIKTDKKYINILGLRIPTYGSIIKLIDYGWILHEKYYKFLNKMAKDVYKNINDMRQIITKHIFIYLFMKHVNKYKLKLISRKELIRKFKKSIYYNYINKLTDNIDNMLLLFCILYPKQYQEMILVEPRAEVIECKLNIPLVDIIYIIINSDNIKLIINYLHKQIK